MLEGLYAAATGMEAQQQQIDAVANDLSNLDTTGYQSERVAFRDLLYSSGGSSNDMMVATGAGAAAQTLGRSELQGAIQSTGRPLDVAIFGQGYLSVRQANGSIGLTRNGVLELDPQGQLTTAQGQPLSPPIRVPAGTPPEAIRIGSDGTVSVGGATVGRIQLVTVPAPDGLLAQGDSMFAVTASSGPLRPAAGARLQQGALEGSNVDIATEMSQMIDAQQTYSMESKAIDFQNQMMQMANGIKR